MAKLEGTDTRALVLIKAELGMAAEVAEQVSVVDGVCWTLMVTGPYDIIAAVRVKDNFALGELVVNRIQNTPGVRNPTTLVATSRWGENGFP
jgi:DNA-binding Lrp family transcriptional regulator